MRSQPAIHFNAPTGLCPLTVRVYTSGVFDLFHAGHLDALERAARLGDELIVGVATDADTVSYKRTPVIPFEQRCRIVAAINCVNEVIRCPMYPTVEFYRRWRIDLHCQGDDLNDYYALAKQLGIIHFVGRSTATETSAIIRRVMDHYVDSS